MKTTYAYGYTSKGEPTIVGGFVSLRVCAAQAREFSAKVENSSVEIINEETGSAVYYATGGAVYHTPFSG